MFRLLIDTCVWLDIAKDAELQPLIGVLEELVEASEVALIVPQIVLDEFERNKKRVIDDSCRSLSGVFRRVKEAVDKFGDPKKKKTVLAHLNDVDHQIPLLGESAVQAIGQIQRLMERGATIDATDEVKLRAVQRAIDKRAPFHRGKNEMGDAIIIETYADCLRETSSKGMRFAFVTHNKEDFSEPHGDNRIPHPDLANMFSRVKSLYFIKLKDALKRINPRVVTITAEEVWTEEPRKLTEILNAMDELLEKVWYGRHGALAYQVEQGKIKVVDKEAYPEGKYDPKLIRRDIWDGARAAARRVEKTYGVEHLGPWSDFEWGMLNGKLSALRWALGDEWDMLDT